jgi:hypothetical protein
VLIATPALAQEVTLLQKYNDWTAYAAAGSPKVCFAVAKPKESRRAVKRSPICLHLAGPRTT